jgi:glycosyltransferase involved in cell wall biosynthesis
MEPGERSEHGGDRPSISVVMPVYNRAAIVERAIASVLAQDHDDFELIVVDDGSSDRTPDIVEAISDPRLKFVRLATNAGGNAARNRGIAEARAPLITFLDSDDRFLPHKLRFVVETFREKPSLDLLLDSFVKTYRPERDRPDVICRNPKIETNAAFLEALFTRRIWKATPGISVRRDAALRAGKFDEALRRRQDFDFILRVAAVGQCATTDELLWVKTYSTDTISADLGKFVVSLLDFYRRHPEYYDHPVYRQGFAHDVGRHFVRLLRHGKFDAARRDAALLVRELGARRFLGLAIGGAQRFRLRRRRLHAD